MTRCQDCDEAQREIANMAEEIAFWAYQAKWYFALATHLGNYDDLDLKKQRAIDATFEEHRQAENRDRIGHVEPAHDIGS